MSRLVEELVGAGVTGTSNIEFGSHQVILMRTAENILALPENVRASDSALCMTVPQSKGLEFEEVFVVNFFSSSRNKAVWRALLDYLETLKERQASGKLVGPAPRSLSPAELRTCGIPDSALRPLKFDREMHCILNEELKLLYTACTRARQRLVFFEEDVEARGPFYYLVASLNLGNIGQRSVYDTDDTSGADNYSAQAFLDRGRHFLTVKLWQPAIKSFVKAGSSALATAAKGLELYYAARKAASKGDRDSQILGRKLAAASVNLLLRAACAAPREPAVKLSEARSWLLPASGMLEMLREYEHAGDLRYLLGPKSWKDALSAYEKGRLFDKAYKLCLEVRARKR